MQPFPVNDPTVWTLIHMIRAAPHDPRPIARLFYYFQVEHPDDVERKYMELLVAQPIMPVTRW